MTLLCSRMAAALLLVMIATPCLADHALRVPLAGHGTLILQVPDGWAERVNRPGADLPPTVTFTPAAGAAFQVLMTPLWAMDAKRPAPTAQRVRAIVVSSLEHVKDQAVEKDIPVLDLSGPQLFGNYFSVTDKAPAPGEFVNMTQGLLAMGELSITFTILSNGERSVVAKPALRMFQSMQRE